MPLNTETSLLVDSRPTDSSHFAINPHVAEQSEPFIGAWIRQVSTTNWEKGKIIVQWRSSFDAEKTEASQVSDEAWVQLVGGVTPQHVGRLRRTFERFGQVHHEYSGIFWSHFYSALDWDDAEMWLEGAVQNRWSVSQMRQQRWETLGKLDEPQPRAGDVVDSEIAEELHSLELSESKRKNDRDYIEGPVHEGPDFGDEDSRGSKNLSGTERESAESASRSELEIPATSAGIRPFESFANLPDDVLDATNNFKVAIIRHKTAAWESISQQDLLGVLDALKQLAQIPSA